MQTHIYFILGQLSLHFEKSNQQKAFPTKVLRKDRDRQNEGKRVSILNEQKTCQVEERVTLKGVIQITRDTLGGGGGVTK